MARTRKRAFASDAERAAHDARVDEHLRIANELIDRRFAEIGMPRPADSLTYVEQVLARKAEREQSH
jgi:hypothetical protein